MSELAAGNSPGTEGGVQNFFEGVKFDGGETPPAAPQAREELTQATQSTPPPSAPAAQPAAAPVAPTPGVPPPTQGTSPAPVQQSLTLSTEQLAALAKELRGPEAPAVAKQPTPEEIDAQFGVVRPTEDQIAQVFRGGPEGVKSLTDMLHGAARMGATIAAHHAVGEIKKLEEWTRQQLGGLAPAREIAEQRQLETHTQAFFQAYPHFTPENGLVLKNVYNKLLAEGFKGTAQEVYAKINEEATALIRSINPQFGVAAAGTGNGANQPPVQPRPVGSRPASVPSQMSQLPMGGSGGSGGPPGNSPGSKSGPEAMFS